MQGPPSRLQGSRGVSVLRNQDDLAAYVACGQTPVGRTHISQREGGSDRNLEFAGRNEACEFGKGSRTGSDRVPLGLDAVLRHCREVGDRVDALWLDPEVERELH